MFSELTRELRPAIVLFVLLTMITGVLYPFAVTGIAVTVFPKAAAGSLVERDGQKVGSRLIGQLFDDPKYFWGRPSATAPFSYNAAASSGSNLGPLNESLEAAVKDRIAKLKNADPQQQESPPVDLVTASASGLDPHISPAAAYYQCGRVARARELSEEAVRGLIAQHIEGRTMGIIGEPRVNVLLLNLALDELH